MGKVYKTSSHAVCDYDLGETLVSCGISGTQDLKGTYLHPPQPHACIASTSNSSYPVTAVANCCVFPKDSIDDMGGIISEDQSNVQVVTKCPYNTTLTGCVVNYQSGKINNIRGSYPGQQQAYNRPPAQVGKLGGINTENQCIAEARTTETNVRGGAQCLKTASNYELGIN